MSARFIEVDVLRVVVNQHRKPFVVLGERDGGRVLPIPIGVNEATAILLALENEHYPRPLTHDLIANVLRDLDARLHSVAVVDLRDHVFHARLDLACDGTHHSIDARPSDAIALALRLGSTVFVAEEVLRVAGTTTDDTARWTESWQRERDKEIEQFRDLLNNIDLDPND